MGAVSQTAASRAGQSGISREPWGITSGGQAVERYTLRNARGDLARIVTFGATVTELWVPDRDGRHADVVLGFDNLKPYETQSPYFGCAVGRVAFRIARGQFELEGQSYQLSLNDGEHHLHGGAGGFSWNVWQARITEDGRGPALEMTLHSPDGDQGYPGNLHVVLVYRLTEAGALEIDFQATTDKASPINLTHHGYFNLGGVGSGTVLNHVLQMDASRWIPAHLPDLPSGTIADVAGTPYDFLQPRAIGERIGQIEGATRGYDLSYLLDSGGGNLTRVATVTDPKSGRVMEVSTTEPGIVLYTGNYLDGTLRGKCGAVYPQYAGLCLETGRLPDSVHHPHFPSTILRPHETYRHRCVYRFYAT